MVAWYKQVVIYHIPLKSVCCQTRLVRCLRVIFVKILGELDFGLFYQFQVSNTADDNTECYRVVGSDSLLRQG